jgi:hypothetical protein
MKYTPTINFRSMTYYVDVIGIDGRKILELVLHKRCRKLSGFIWLRIENSCGLL